MAIEGYPSTGESKKVEDKKNTKLSPVTKGVVSSEKKIGFFERLGGGSVGDVKSYLLTDILLPAAKNLIGDLIGDGIHMLLWGSPGAKKDSRYGGRVSYGSYYNDRKYGSRHESRRDEPQTTKSAYQFDDIIINSRAEAEEVITLMREIVDMYGRVSIADYYELVGVTGQYTDCDYGWKSLSGVDVRRTKNGYFIDLPKAMPIK